MKNHKMKIVFTITLSLVAGVALAVDDATISKIDSKATSAQSKADGNNSRIQGLESDVGALQTKVANIELTPGPQGETGATGPVGPQGLAGPDGAVGPAAPAKVMNMAANYATTTFTQGDTSVFARVMCAVGEVATGGGYEFTQHATENTHVMLNSPMIAEADWVYGWHVRLEITPPATSYGNLRVWVLCARLYDE